MTRSAVASLLADLLTRRLIRKAEAEQVLDLYDAGLLTSSDLAALPPQQNDDWLAALLLVLLLTGGNTTTRLSAAKRRFARNTLRTGFELNTARLASSVTSGALTPPAWQAAMQGTIIGYTRQMAVAGAGALPGVATRATVDGQLAEQWPYLQRFSIQMVVRRVALRQAQGPGSVGELVEPSAQAVAGRAGLYGGVGWSAFWLAASAVAIARGTIVHFISRDDPNTCSSCHHAAINGPYVAGSSPTPGWSVCQGGGRCRCELRYEYNPELYAQLTGQRRAA